MSFVSFSSISALLDFLVFPFHYSLKRLFVFLSICFSLKILFCVYFLLFTTKQTFLFFYSFAYHYRYFFVFLFICSSLKILFCFSFRLYISKYTFCFSISLLIIKERYLFVFLFVCISQNIHFLFHFVWVLTCCLFQCEWQRHELIQKLKDKKILHEIALKLFHRFI